MDTAGTLEFVPDYLTAEQKRALLALTVESDPEPAPLVVNEYVIRHWCEALEDGNRLYLDEAYARTQFSVLRHFDFADHHSYTADDIQSIVDFCNRQGKPLSILTTEKDMVKLLPFGDALVFPWFYLPIETVFIDNGAEFDGLIREAIQS